MGIPVKYRQGSEGAVASYDFFDIAEGTGIETFYCGTNALITHSSGANAQSDVISGATLFQNQFYSGTPETSRFESTVDNNIFLTINFDVADFNIPKIVKGKAYFEGPIYCQTGAAGQAHWSAVKLQKVDGLDGTITDLCSNFSGAVVSVGDFIVDFIPLTLSGSTHFRAGDKLRLYAQARYISGIANRRLVIAHDPYDRDGTYIKPSVSGAMSTIMRVHVPFKIDL